MVEVEDADLERLGKRFADFAREARAYAGPLYEALSHGIAHDPELLRIARHVRRPPIPNVLFGVVHFLLLSGEHDHPLVRFYGSLSATPEPPGHAFDHFREFVLSRESTIVPLLETRITQTNEVSRCSFLLPSFTEVFEQNGERPLAIVDVGCSAGLHLFWDRYHYDYGTTSVGNRDARVSIRCELLGTVPPPLPRSLPPCPFRVGIDLHPVNLEDATERRWFDALIWPEHSHRRRLANAALLEVVRDPPHVVRGDAALVLADVLNGVPRDTSLIVYNSAALCQGGEADVAAVRRTLEAHASQRRVDWLFCEGEEVLLRTFEGDTVIERLLARKDGHGRWLDWLPATSHRLPAR